MALSLGGGVPKSVKDPRFKAGCRQKAEEAL